MELRRSIGHVDGESAIIITPKRKRANGKNMFCIMEQDMWRLIEPQYMLQAAAAVNEYFDLGLATPQKLAKIAFFLQDGIEECLMLKPEEGKEKRVIAEGKMSVDGGQPLYFEITE